MKWYEQLKRHLPWYGWLDRQLQPLNAGLVVILLLIAGITLWVAIWGARPAKAAWIVYLLSP